MTKDTISELNLTVHYTRSHELANLQASDDIFDVILLAPPFNRADKHEPFRFETHHESYLLEIEAWLGESLRHLHKHGAMLVYGLPRWLPYFAEYLHQRMTFKYWIVLKNPQSDTGPILPALHEGVLFFVKHAQHFTINQVRSPHIMCSQCGDFLADWGGKKHLRHEYGTVVSDVWDDRNDFIDDEHGLAPHTLSRLLELTCKPEAKVLIAAYDNEPYPRTNPLPTVINTPSHTMLEPVKAKKIARPSPQIEATNTIDFKPNEIFIGDCVEVLADLVANEAARFDLIFADPPYNLQKEYGKAQDDLAEQEYIQWCDKWLYLCTKLLKPHGSLYVLNLPKWSYFHATLLNKYLYFQHWIVWDALSDPRGKVMPAHYGLLLYTQHPTQFTFNPMPPIPTMEQCLRPKCIQKRVNAPTEAMSDIWYDVHRIKHKRDRDSHPCQLPHKLLEHVIQISSNLGDLVLDPFLGTGTTAIVAKRLGRYYAGIDIDVKYRDIATEKLLQIPPKELQISPVTIVIPNKQLALF